MLVLTWVFLVILALASLTLLLSLIAVAKFYRKKKPKHPKMWPKISVIKPVKGLDPASEEGFRSFIEQDYPDFEIIFAVEGFDDPVLPLIQRLQSEYKNKDIKLVHSQPREDVMGKVNNLLAAKQVASSTIYVCADSDVIANKTDLKELVSLLLSSDKIGIVAAMPIYRRMKDFGSGLLGAYYSPFMITFYSIKYFFGPHDTFPSTYFAIKRDVLTKAGGWERVADNIADDSTVGQFVYEAGFDSIMSQVKASIPEPHKSLSNFWQHQHRWHLTYKFTISSTLYLLSLLAHPSILAIFMLFLGEIGVVSAISYWVLRYFWVIILNIFVIKEPAMWRVLWLLPISELVLTASWFRALVQTTTVWRGIRYRVKKGGKLVRIGDK